MYAGDSDIFQALEGLVGALQLAERSGQYKQAAELQDKLRDVEESNPVTALAWRRQRQVLSALDTVLLGIRDPLQSRLEAIQALEQLASPPFPESAAEEALHRILCEVSGDGAGQLRDAAETSLWNCWHSSGDEDVDELLRKGIDLMERRELQEALHIFSKVIDAKPDFAEGWNKRATAFYVLEDYERSIADCARVLELKPKHFGCLCGLGMIYKCQGENLEAVKWYKKTLSVHPCMFGPRQSLDSIERESNVEEQLGPKVMQAVEAFEQGLDGPEQQTSESLNLQWDVHRVSPQAALESDSAARIYVFRVRVRNKSIGTHPVRSLARFYALRFATGQVAPLMRPTEGESEFVLEPGEEYKYSWAFTVGQELIGMAGGMLFECLDKVSQSDTERFLTASLDMLKPVEAPEISMVRVQKLIEDYVYMGQLDLRLITDSRSL